MFIFVFVYLKYIDWHAQDASGRLLRCTFVFVSLFANVFLNVFMIFLYLYLYISSIKYSVWHA